MLIVHKINALDPAVKPAGLPLGEFITREANEAAEVKREKPILVVLGNPPYSGHSANRSYVDRKRKQPTWIGKLLEDYKQVDGQPLEEKNPKWLQDDYVKFIRFAEWRIERTGQGVVAFITNHAYLDNPTFRGMRAHLLRTFQRLYIVNLHGNARRKERAPNGSPDENLFDIQQGVALLIAVRAPDKFPNADVIDTNADVIDTIDDVIDKIGDPDDNAPLLYYDVWGSREAKYAFLREATLDTIDWTPILPRAPMYLFVPQDTALEAEYQRGWRIPDIFPVHSVGIVTARDALTIHRTPDAVWQTVCELVALEPEAARERFRLGKDVRDWSVARAQQDLREAGVPNESAKACIVPILYRPFDVRYTFYTGRSRGFHCMPRPKVMRYLLVEGNVALVVGRAGSATGDEEWNIVFVAQQPVDLNIFRRGGGEVYPLYEYPKTKSEQGALLPEVGRKANLSAAFLEALAGVLGHEPVPEAVLGYLYAVLHSPAYRARYAEFLKRDFPRVPLPPDRATFDALARLGNALIDLHLLRDPALQTPSCKYPVAGDHRVERVEYEARARRVWINKAQYFEPVPAEVWDYRVGGVSGVPQVAGRPQGRDAVLRRAADLPEDGDRAGAHAGVAGADRRGGAAGVGVVSWNASRLKGKVYFPRGACSTWRAGLRGSGFERVYGATRASRARTHNRARVEHVDRRRGEGLPRRGRPLQPHSGQGVPSESRLCARRQDSASDYGGRAARLFHPARAGLSRAAGCQRRAAAAGRVVP
jgi:predicted helicase